MSEAAGASQDRNGRGEDPGPEQEAGPATPGLSRRVFIGVAASAAATIAAVRLTGAAEVLVDDAPSGGTTAASSHDSWVMVIDLAKCDGCNKCTKACQESMNVPAGQEWIKVYKVTDEYGHEAFFPRPCMNCENAPCQEVCPVGATFTSPDGVVLVDHLRCIGCRYCMAACPYNARSFTWETPKYPKEVAAHRYSPEEPWPLPRNVAAKCVVCAHRAREGQLPYCVTGCPMGAIYLGNKREDAVTNGLGETIPLHDTLRLLGGYRWKEELGTEPRVFYLPARGLQEASS